MPGLKLASMQTPALMTRATPSPSATGPSGDGHALACFSAEYNNRSKTYMNEELILAIEEIRQRPTDHVWFIPVLLSPCEVPDRSIGAGETLRSIQHVKLYNNWDDGIQRLISVIRSNLSREAIPPINIHFTEYAYYHSGVAVEFCAVVDEKRINCAISLEVLIDHFGSDIYNPMSAFIDNRQDIEQIANRLIKSRWLENDGTVLIRTSDVIARS